MSFIHYNSHYKVAANKEQDLRNRIWAFRSCCCAVQTLVRVVDTNEIIDAISARINATIEIHKYERRLAEVRYYEEREIDEKYRFAKYLLVTNLSEATLLLNEYRNRLKTIKCEYDRARSELKKQNKRFPVAKHFERNFVLRLISKI